jgi:peptide/nickel transport system substrate-binding protein
MSNKRWALISVLALAFVVVLSACAPTSTGAVTEVPGGGEEPAGPVKDTIIICMGQEPDSLLSGVQNMVVAVEVLHSMSGLGFYYDDAFFFGTRMLVNDEFPSFDNGGATLVDGVLSVTYTYKDNITWSDGTPFTVDDVLFTYDTVMDPDSGVVSRGALGTQVFEKVDDHTLKVTYPAGVLDPTYFLPPLSGPNSIGGDILPKHFLEGMAPADMITSDYARGDGPVLGPYAVTEWVAGDHISLDRVEDWWGGEVKTPHLIYRFIADSNQLLASVLAGECDFGTSDVLNVSQLPFIQQSAERGLLKYDAIPSTTWEHIDFNNWPVVEGVDEGGMPFFADARVRQAVGYAVNRQEMTESILLGAVTPLDSYLPSDHWAFSPNTTKDTFDPEKAKSLLEEAGWTDSDGDGVREAASALSGEYSCGGSWSIPAGTKLQLTLTIPATPSFRGQISTAVQAYMAEVGMGVTINTQAAGVVFADEGPLNRRRFQMVEYAYSTSPDPSNIGLYGSINVYKFDPDVLGVEPGATGPFLTADTLLAAKPDLLDGTGITEEMFSHGRPVAEAPDASKLQFLASDLPDGLKPSDTDDKLGLAYPEQVPEPKDDWEGQNGVGWCNSAATQALYDGDNLLDPAERAPFHQAAQDYFMAELPTLPLFQRVEVTGQVNSLCGPVLGPSNYVSWNIQTWYFDETGACE